MNGRDAFVLVDLQRDVVGPPGSKFRAIVDAIGVVENASRLAKAFRAAGLPVILIRVERDPQLRDQVDRDTDRSVGATPAMQTNPYRTIPHTEGWEFAEGFEIDETDIIVTKRRVNAFHATPLDLYLRRLGVSRLVVGGVYTHRGVESTVRGAWDHDYNTIVVSDCCASRPESMHQHALEWVLPEFSRVMTTDEVIAEALSAKAT